MHENLDEDIDYFTILIKEDIHKNLQNFLDY
jgi:hypothetical protein